jgi:hypothetical protein
VRYCSKLIIYIYIYISDKATKNRKHRMLHQYTPLITLLRSMVRSSTSGNHGRAVSCLWCRPASFAHSKEKRAVIIRSMELLYMHRMNKIQDKNNCRTNSLTANSLNFKNDVLNDVTCPSVTLVAIMDVK